MKGGANVDVTEEGLTLLDVALDNGHQEVSKWLLASNIFRKDEDAKAPISPREIISE